jgi:hypothetical protein
MKYAEPQPGKNICVNRMDTHVFGNRLRGSSRNVGLAFADIGRPEQDAPRQVRELDIVAVNDSNIPNTEKGKILQDLIA